MCAIAITALSILETHYAVLVNNAQAKLQVLGEYKGHVLDWGNVY
jgi:hypothetical protein